jgi:D-serine dehydratase
VTLEEVGVPSRLDLRQANAVLGDIAFPVMLLKESALENNLRVMARYALENGFVLAPHGKTTMAPQLFRRQLDAGAWAITVANMDQAAVAYRAGAERVFVANEIVGRADTRSIVAALGAGEHELYCLVDSVLGVDTLNRHLGAAGMVGKLNVLVELGTPGGRAGARSQEEAVAVARSVEHKEHLQLVGVEGYEGVLAADRSAEAISKVDDYLEGLRRLAVRLADEGAFAPGAPVLVSAGGSRFFDRVARALGPSAPNMGHDIRLIVRSGCYLVHDHGAYAKASPLSLPGQYGTSLVAALEVWAEVLSRPEADLAIVGLGKRDVSYDLGLPVPLRIVQAPGGHVAPFTSGFLSALNDQHGLLRLTGQPGEVGVGDRIGFGLSHPCTAFDKWRTVQMVDDDYQIREEIQTFFH